MFIDRPQSIQIVDNKLQATDTEFLNVYLDDVDVELLADPARGYTTDRFMGCTDGEGLNGWAFEDKIHIRLETPMNFDENDKFVELSLDGGGDLYFSIWNSSRLQSASPHEEFIAESPFVIADPSHKLRQVGIQAIRSTNFPT